jgi:hypothetical protein
MRCIICLALLMLWVETASCETVYGDCFSEDCIEQAVREWEFRCLNTADRNRYQVNQYLSIPLGTAGVFAFCVDSSDRAKLIYGYTYGESSQHRAEEKALYALRTRGYCVRTPKIFRKSMAR